MHTPLFAGNPVALADQSRPKQSYKHPDGIDLPEKGRYARHSLVCAYPPFTLEIRAYRIGSIFSPIGATCNGGFATATLAISPAINAKEVFTVTRPL